MNVLIAEDEKDASNIYRVALQSKGHNVTITSNGQECLQLYKNAANRSETGENRFLDPPYDAVVLDYRMPKLDGLETAKAILKIHPEQRIIFASSYVRETLSEMVESLQTVVELIEKPFEAKNLLELIENTSTIQELREINKSVVSMDIHHMSIGTRDIRKGLERMSGIFGSVIIQSLIKEVEERGIALEREESYSANDLQSLLKSILGDHVGIFLMRFFMGYFRKDRQAPNYG